MYTIKAKRQKVVSGRRLANLPPIRFVLLALAVFLAQGNELLFAAPCSSPLPISVNGAACAASGVSGTVTSATTPGLNAINSGGRITATNVIVNLGATTPTNRDGYIGARAQAGGVISFDDGTIKTAQGVGNGQRGLLATGSGSQINASGSAVTLGLGTGTTAIANDLVGARAEASGTMSLTGVTMTILGGTNGLRNYGLQAIGANSSISFSNGGSVSIRSAGTVAAFAEAGGVISFNGSTIATVNQATSGQRGLLATGSGSQINASGSVVTLGLTTTAVASDLVGARAELGGTMSLQNVTMTIHGGTSGANNYGLQATGAGSSISFSNGGSVSIRSAGAVAALAEPGGMISFDGSTISSYQATSGQRGLLATGSGSQINASGSSVTLGLGTTTANDLVGARAELGGTMSLQNVTMTILGGTNGLRNYGLQATGAGSSISFSGGSVSTLSRGAFAVFAENGGVISLNNSAQINTTGTYTTGTPVGSHALMATGLGSQITGNNIVVSTMGAQANAAKAEAGGVITLENSTLSTAGGGNELNPAAVIRVMSGGSVNATNSTLTASGGAGYGIQVVDVGSQAIVSGATIEVSGGRSIGLSIKDGGVMNITDSRIAVIQGSTGPWWPGAQVEGAGSTLTMTNSQINTVPNTSLGMSVSAGANAVITGGSITTSGKDSTALSAANATITATNLTVVTTGDDNAVGALADLGGQVHLIGGSITTSGNSVRTSAFAHGLSARNPGGTLTADGTVVHTYGSRAIGAVTDDGGTMVLNDITIRTAGETSLGAFSVVEQAGAQFPATLTINRGSIETFGVNAYGAAAQARNDLAVPVATITCNNVTILTHGAGATGLRAVLADYGIDPPTGRGEAVTIANDSLVTTEGEWAHGAFSRDMPTSVTMNRTTVQTSGANAYGAMAESGGRLVGFDSRVSATGADAMALYTLGEPGAVSTATFMRSTLTNVAGPTIGVAGNGTIALTDSTASGSGQWLRVGTTDDFPHKAGTPPPTSVYAGQAKLTLIRSTVTGSAFTAVGSFSEVTLADNSLWHLTGNSNVSNLYNEASLIDFTSPVGHPLSLSSYKTLTVNNLVGAGGIIGLNTFLQEDGSPSDLVVIDGGVASGSNRLGIKNSGGLGAVTRGNGILVVDMVNGGTSSVSSFALTNPEGYVAAGPYAYTLQRGGIGGSESDKWYLRSTINCSSDPGHPACEAPTPPPVPPVPPTPVPPTPVPPTPSIPIPNYRPETSLYSTIPALALRYSHAVLDTFHERMGEEREGRAAAALRPDKEDWGPSRGWGRVIGRYSSLGGGEQGPAGFFSPDYDVHLQAVQVGVDLYRKEKSDGGFDQAGVSLAYGHGDSTVDLYKGRGRAGRNTLDGYSLGAYWTRFGASDWYLDSVVQLNFYDINVDTVSHPGMDVDGWGWSASIEGGAPFALDEDRTLFLEPQAQLIYSRVELDDSRDYAAAIQFVDADSLLGRLGFRLAKDWSDADETFRKTTLWIRPSLWHNFAGEPTTTFSSSEGGVPFEADLSDNWYELNAGIDHVYNENLSLYISAGWQQSFDGDSYGYEAMGGIKVRF